MKDFTRKNQMFSLCGLNCALCPMHIGRYCPGCGGGPGNQSCAIARCSLAHAHIEYCYECTEYPCSRYEGINEYDSFITHQNRVKDMKKAADIGINAYNEEQSEKADMLYFLLDNYNDGRKKNLFCTAVNLMEIEDLRRIKDQLITNEEIRQCEIKERAVYAAELIKKTAKERNIILKLRKKPAGKNSKKD